MYIPMSYFLHSANNKVEILKHCKQKGFFWEKEDNLQYEYYDHYIFLQIGRLDIVND